MNKIVTILFSLFALLTAQVSYANTASEVVTSVNKVLMKELKENKDELEQHSDQIYQLVEKDIVPFIDFESFSKLILSVHWKTATSDQRERFTQAFKKMLMNTYAKSLLDYSDTQLNILRETPGAKPQYVKVYAEFVVGNGKPNVSVVFEMKKFGEAWKAYNVTVGSFSIVKNFRTSFSREINQHGLDGLISRLENNQIK